MPSKPTLPERLSADVCSSVTILTPDFGHTEVCRLIFGSQEQNEALAAAIVRRYNSASELIAFVEAVASADRDSVSFKAFHADARALLSKVRG